MERTYFYNCLTPEDLSQDVYYIYFTRKGKWCYLIAVHDYETATSVVRKEQHTDDVHGLKPALYAIVVGGLELDTHYDLHNQPIVVEDKDLIKD